VLRIAALTILLISLTPKYINSSEIVIKEGDTLHKIAEENNISLRELMNINEIYDANKVMTGQKIKIPDIESESLNQTKSSNKIQDLKKDLTISSESTKSINHHIVQHGDTLSKISKIYNIPIKDLAEINELPNPSSIKVSQIIYLNYKEKKPIKIRSEETSSDISNLKISTQSQKSSDWKDYGSLKVNWSKWNVRDGNHIAPTINKSGQPLFIALNCETRKINATKGDGQWREWFAPKEVFEFNLLNDICKD
tara:strand:+ start:524 stop:1282 length:759 start_codon:yes stop_codon:yes gene_type:complete